jgi:hypothetical protein
VIQLLTHENFDVQVRACWALSEISIEPGIAIAALSKLLRTEDDNRVVAVAIETLSHLQPTDDASKLLFVEHLNDPNEFVRFGCVAGLSAFADEKLIDPLMRVPSNAGAGPLNQLTQFDEQVVRALVANGRGSKPKIVQYIDDAEPVVRGRAIRAAAELKALEDGVREKIIAALDDQSLIVKTAAAKAIGSFEEVEPNVLQKMFALTDPNQRQLTVDMLELFGQMQEKASAITPEIASLMNGHYRNRFVNDAKKVLVDMGPHAAPALTELFQGNLDLQKMGCVAAIGAAAKPYGPKISKYIERLDQQIIENPNLNRRTNFRRDRLAATVALAKATGNLQPAVEAIKQELPTDLQNWALLAAKQLVSEAPELVEPVIALLPKPEAINALAEMGGSAVAAVPRLQELAAGDNPDVASISKRALWLIRDDPHMAIAEVERLLLDNRFEAVEIRIEQRQELWELLRFLGERHIDNPKVKALLQSLLQGRFPNLRAFAKQFLE